MDRLTTPSLEKVAPLYREWLLYSQIQAVSPIFSMFSKFAVLVYCLPVIVYILDCDLEPWMKIAAVSCYSMASLVVLIVYLLQQDISVKSGQAPVDRLNIAYKFSPPTESLDGLNKEVRKIARQFSELRRIFFFYTTTDVSIVNFNYITSCNFHRETGVPFQGCAGPGKKRQVISLFSLIYSPFSEVQQIAIWLCTGTK